MRTDSKDGARKVVGSWARLTSRMFTATKRVGGLVKLSYRRVAPAGINSCGLLVFMTSVSASGVTENVRQDKKRNGNCKK